MKSVLPRPVGFGGPGRGPGPGPGLGGLTGAIKDTQRNLKNFILCNIHQKKVFTQTN